MDENSKKKGDTKSPKSYETMMEGASQLSDEELVKLGRELKKGRVEKLK